MRRTILALLLLSYIGTYTRVEHSPGCLYTGLVLYRCYPTPGIALLGGAQTDAAYRVGELRLVAPDGRVAGAGGGGSEVTGRALRPARWGGG